MIKRFLPKSEFSKNVSRVAGGTVISQAITLAFAPVLTRLFSPADFGLLSIFSSMAVAIAIVSTFRYELAVMLPQKDEEAINVVSLSFVIVLFYSLAVLLALLIGGKPLLHLIRADDLEKYVPLVVVFVFFYGVMNILNYWLSRKKMFGRLSSGKVVQSAFMGLFSVLLFFIGFKHGGLLMGLVIGQTGIGILYLFFFYKDWRQWRLNVSIPKMKEMFKRYIHFLTYNTPHALLDSFRDLIVIVLIRYYFGTAAAGLYFMCFRILNLPAGIISSATGQVFFQRINELFPDGKAVQLEIGKLYKQLFILSVPIFSLLIIAGPFIFSLALGKEWAEAGIYSRILAPCLMIGFVISPVSFLPVVTKSQSYAIVLGIIDLIIRVGGILIGAYYNSMNMGLACISGGVGLLYIYIAYWYYHLPVSNKVKQYV